MISKLLNIDKTELHQPRSIWSTFKNAYLRRKNFKKLNFEIISFDNLIYYKNKNKYISNLKSKNFIYGDINDTKLVKKIMKQLKKI